MTQVSIILVFKILLLIVIFFKFKKREVDS